jgi:hypothetical protein
MVDQDLSLWCLLYKQSPLATRLIESRSVESGAPNERRRAHRRKSTMTATVAWGRSSISQWPEPGITAPEHSLRLHGLLSPSSFRKTFRRRWPEPAWATVPWQEMLCCRLHPDQRRGTARTRNAWRRESIKLGAPGGCKRPVNERSAQMPVVDDGPLSAAINKGFHSMMCLVMSAPMRSASLAHA